MKDRNKINSETWRLCVCVFSASLQGGSYMKRRKRQKEKRKMRRKRRALTKDFCYRHTTPWRGWRSSCTRSESLAFISLTCTLISQLRPSSQTQMCIIIEFICHAVRLNGWHQAPDTSWVLTAAFARTCHSPSIRKRSLPNQTPISWLQQPLISILHSESAICRGTGTESRPL